VVPNPSRIICVGLNYHDTSARRTVSSIGRTRDFERPMIFAPLARIAYGASPADLSPESLDAAGLRGRASGRHRQGNGRYVTEEKALEYVFGYSCLNEACLRDYQRHSRQINPGKNFEKTGATGRGW